MDNSSLERISKRYRALFFGDVAKGYTDIEESIVYREVANLISAKYGDIISKEEIESILASKGKIFTMVVKNRVAFYEYQTGNIGIPHFLRLTTTLCHELVHKLGYLQKDSTFSDMNPVFKEAGTEFVSATSLDDKFGRILIFNGVYGKFPEKTDEEYLSIALVNQLNQALGGKSLERSILRGHDYFKEEIIKRWGNDYYVHFSENIKDIARIESEYWKEYRDLDEDEKATIETDLKHRIADFQDTIIDVEFGSRVQNVKTREEAESFLKELKEFGMNRIRYSRSSPEGKREYYDPNFVDIFEHFKQNLEVDFGNIDIQYDEFEWVKRFPKKEIIKEVSEQEADEVYLLARDIRKSIKASKGLAAFISKVFKDKGSDNKVLLSRPIEKYTLNYDPLNVEEIKPTNTVRQKVQEDYEK